MSDFDMRNKPDLIVIAGPTASGKTAVAVKLAEFLNGSGRNCEIIGADSMQIYRELSIGTAKPAPDETHGIPHHMIDVASIADAIINPFSVADYVSMAGKIADDIISCGKIPIVCGGTGLYIDHLIAGTTFTDTALHDDAYRESLAELSNDDLHAKLTAVDPESAGAIHPNNRKRVIRSLEIYHLSGSAKSALDKASVPAEPRYNAMKFVLTFGDRDKLYSRIDARTDKMIAGGFIDEVALLRNDGYEEHLRRVGAIGYPEILDYLGNNYIGGEKITLEQTVALIKQHTRNYAKRQITWFAKDKSAEFIESDDETPESYSYYNKICEKVEILKK
ncbi:tRNA dimethylallyltransferase [Clostridia bacterium]|nr:tRNA dimethylallyltransferase [Clostridia bacterium]